MRHLSRRNLCLLDRFIPRNTAADVHVDSLKIISLGVTISTATPVVVAGTELAWHVLQTTGPARYKIISYVVLPGRNFHALVLECAAWT